MFLSFSWASRLSPLAGVEFGVCDKKPQVKALTRTAVSFLPMSWFCEAGVGPSSTFPIVPLTCGSPSWSRKPRAHHTAASNNRRKGKKGLMRKVHGPLCSHP